MINDYEATEPIVPESDTHATIDNDEVISKLNGLIETCKDGQMGFQEASEGVEINCGTSYLRFMLGLNNPLFSRFPFARSGLST